MKEILGDHLMHFMVTISDQKDYERHQRTYKGNRYEVWEVDDELFEDMCNMSEEKFVELAGDDAWWRQSDGSNLGAPDTTVYIKDNEMLGWRGIYDDCCDDDDYCDPEERSPENCLRCMMDRFTFSSLSEYLCDKVGVSQPKNVCACAMDLAKYNNMSMGALFKKYEG